jgi:hypothetical protein
MCVGLGGAISHSVDVGSKLEDIRGEDHGHSICRLWRQQGYVFHRLQLTLTSRVSGSAAEHRQLCMQASTKEQVDYFGLATH